jgi:hypothetical protein
MWHQSIDGRELIYVEQTMVILKNWVGLFFWTCKWLQSHWCITQMLTSLYDPCLLSTWPQHGPNISDCNSRRILTGTQKCEGYCRTWNRCEGNVSKQTAYADLKRERRQYKNIARSDFWWVCSAHSGEPMECTAMRRIFRFLGLAATPNWPSSILRCTVHRRS